MEETSSRLAAHLGAADPAEVAKCVAILQAQFPVRETSDVSAAARAEGYMLALEGVPLFAMKEAVRRVLKGEVPDISPKFMPTSAQLRDLVNRISLPARAHAVQMRRLLSAEVEKPVAREGRELPAAVSEFLGSFSSRRRGPANPAGVDHSHKEGF